MGSEGAEEEEEDRREKISVEEVNLPLPPAADGVTFGSFIRSKSDLESFKQFLERTNNKGIPLEMLNLILQFLRSNEFFTTYR